MASVCNISVTLNEYRFGYISIYLKSAAGTRNEGFVSISTKGPQITPSTVITLSSAQLCFFLDKFERLDFDGIVPAVNWIIDTTMLTTPPSFNLKLFRYDCGGCYIIEFHNKRVFFDQEMVNGLLFAEEQLHAFNRE